MNPLGVGLFMMATSILGLAMGNSPGAMVFVLVLGTVLAGVGVVQSRPLPKVAPKEDRRVDQKPPPPPDAPIPFEELRRRYGERAVALIRPYPPHRAPVGRSRFGGLPDLPAGLPWPRGMDPERKRELPLHFLAQIDVAELPWRPKGFPTVGTLLFFGRVDETMSWDEDPVRVLFDPSSSGARTLPPEDLTPIEDGHNDFDRTFRLDGEPGMRVYPEWPLLPVAIDSMPDVEAIVQNGYHHPAYVDYPAALMQFRADQLTAASGLPVADRRKPLPIFATRGPDGTVLAPPSETGFPWVAGAVVLIARSVLKGAPTLLDAPTRAALDSWRLMATGRAPSEPWSKGDSQAFVYLLDELLAAADPHMRDRIASLVEEGVQQLVVQAGGDPALAARIPDGIYEAARTAHSPILRTRPIGPDEVAGGVKWTRDDHQRTQYHQMFGHVPSSQGAKPVDSKQVCLLHLQSDYGINLMLCDLGEADFWLEGEDFAALRLDRVFGTTAGG